MNLISVVILNFNGRRYLNDCLSSLASQTCRDLGVIYEVIVVDNASTDGSVENLQAQFPWVRLVKNEKNLGFAGGSNVGIRLAQGDFVMTLNNDTLSDDRLLEYMIKPMQADRDVGMCAAKMLFLDGRINSAGTCISRSGAAWDRGMFENDQGQYDMEEEVFGPCAGAALYRKEMLEEIGLFDEDFFLYMEDVDLAFRGRLAGWKCVYVPKAKVYHHHGGTAGFGSDLPVYYGNRNIIWYVIKDFPIGLLITSFPFILARNLAVVPYYALRGQGRVILRSKLDALRGIPKMLGKRGRVQLRASSRSVCRFIKTWSNINRQ
jgi:GT2 family glycosyltransferase